MKISKLFFAFMALSMLFTLASCSDDDDDNNSIVGTWVFSKIASVEVKTNSEENDAKLKPYLQERGETVYKNLKLTFTEDGKLTFVTEEETTEATYTFVDGVLTTTFDWGSDGKLTEELNANIDGNTLHVQIDFLAEAEELNANALAEIGITDADYSVTKADLTVTFAR